MAARARAVNGLTIPHNLMIQENTFDTNAGLREEGGQSAAPCDQPRDLPDRHVLAEGTPLNENYRSDKLKSSPWPMRILHSILPGSPRTMPGSTSFASNLGPQEEAFLGLRGSGS